MTGRELVRVVNPSHTRRNLRLFLHTTPLRNDNVTNFSADGNRNDGGFFYYFFFIYFLHFIRPSRTKHARFFDRTIEFFSRQSFVSHQRYISFREKKVDPLKHSNTRHTQRDSLILFKWSCRCTHATQFHRFTDRFLSRLFPITLPEGQQKKPEEIPPEPRSRTSRSPKLQNSSTIHAQNCSDWHPKQQQQRRIPNELWQFSATTTIETKEDKTRRTQRDRDLVFTTASVPRERSSPKKRSSQFIVSSPTSDSSSDCESRMISARSMQKCCTMFPEKKHAIDDDDCRHGTDLDLDGEGTETNLVCASSAVVQYVRSVPVWLVLVLVRWADTRSPTATKCVYRGSEINNLAGSDKSSAVLIDSRQVY